MRLQYYYASAIALAIALALAHCTQLPLVRLNMHQAQRNPVRAGNRVHNETTGEHKRTALHVPSPLPYQVRRRPVQEAVEL